jgi:hypothetical protein
MVHRSVRVLLVLVVAAAALVVAAVPAAAKLPPFTVTASPATVEVGEPVTVVIALRDTSYVVPEDADYLGPELGNMLSVRAVLPSGTPDGTHEGERLAPTRVSSSRWQATYVPKRVGEFAIVTFGNVVVDPTNEYVPAPVPITVRDPETVAAVAPPARATPVADGASRAPAPTSASSSAPTMWFATGGLVAVLAVLAAAVSVVWARRRRTRPRVA